MDHLIGTDTLKPYMHGFFVDLRLYTKARAIANPFAYAEYRDRLIREKLEKERESRIRGASNNKRIAQLEKQAKESAKLVEKAKVNKELAERIRLKEEKEERLRIRREEYKKAKAAAKEGAADGAEVGDSAEEPEEDEQSEADSEEEATTSAEQKKPSILSDNRFKDLFTNPDFEVDEDSLEFAMLNPSSATTSKRTKDKQAIERVRASDLMGDDLDEEMDEDDLDEDESDDGGSDSSDEGDLGQYDPRMGKSADRAPRGEVDARTGKRKAPNQMREIEAVRAARKAKKEGYPASAGGASRRPRLVVDGDEAESTARTLGQRLHVEGAGKESTRQGRSSMRGSQPAGTEVARALPGGGMEYTFVPTTTADQDARDERRAMARAKGKANPEDTSITERQAKATLKAGKFAAGLEKADSAAMINARANLSMDEDVRSGRKGMRRDIRSASRNKTRYL